MRVIDGALWTLTKTGLHRFDGARWTRIAEGRYVGIVRHAGELVVASPGALYRVAGDGLAPIPGAEASPGPIQAIASYAETVYCLAYDRLFTFDGRDYSHGDVVVRRVSSKDLRDVLAVSRLIVASHAGLGVLPGERGDASGSTGCPTRRAWRWRRLRTGLLMAGTRGAVRVLEDDFHYFAGARWLPDDRVNAIQRRTTPYTSPRTGPGHRAV